MRGQVLVAYSSSTAAGELDTNREMLFSPAPGGWTKYLAVDRHCARVFAVDPGALELAGA